MSAIANRYKRGDLVGIGFEADFGGCRCHCIAWENAQVERLRDDPVFTEGLIIDSIAIDAMFHSLCDATGKQIGEMKARIDELESHLTQLTNMNSEELKLFLKGFELVNGTYADVTGECVENPKPIKGVGGFGDTVDNYEPIVTLPAYVNGDYLGDVVAMSPPEVIATHETIEPAISETPVEPIQEPVAGVSELTASPPAQAPDTPVEAVAEVDPAKCVLGPHWEPTPGDSEAATIRSFLKRFGAEMPTKSVIDTLAKFGVVVTSSQVLLAKKAVKQ